MNYSINIQDFIRKHIIDREQSMFYDDVQNHHKDLKEKIEGKSFLVIGGAGTIGSSYIKAILPFRPGSITVVDYNENGLTELVRDIRSTPDLVVPELTTYAFDFGSHLMDKLLDQKHFDAVASFAAHKHVRSEKDILAVEALMINNVFNMRKLLEQCKHHKPQHVFAVSTDKASNPVNVMGGSKKLMENIILAYAPSVKVSTARFANVAFSNGSLLDGFNYRLTNGQPISAPSDVKRYFVSPEESGQICMIASLLSNSGDIFFPKLEESSMKTFSEIADFYLSELGLVPDLSSSEEEAREKSAARKPGSRNYPVYYFKSDTTGEKPYEEFYTAEENPDLEKFKALGVISHAGSISVDKIDQQLREIKDLFADPKATKEQLVDLMRRYIPRFDHIETGKYLDSKM